MYVCVCVQLLSHVKLFVTPLTVAHKAPLSKELSRQEYWRGLPFPTPGDLPHPCVSCVSCTSRGSLYHWYHLGSPKIPHASQQLENPCAPMKTQHSQKPTNQANKIPHNYV